MTTAKERAERLLGMSHGALILHAQNLEQLTDELVASLQECLRFVDEYRRMSGGDGDITAMNARAALARAKELK